MQRARPAGVLGAEVWVKLVDADQPAPTDPAALTFLTMTTKPSFRAEFKAGEGGKTAVYMARWINTRGEKGEVVGRHDGDGALTGEEKSQVRVWLCGSASRCQPQAE